jgi:hypothetical protein
MVKPDTLNPHPSVELTLLGGLVASLLLSALLYVAPALDFPFINMPHLIGGIFTSSADVAFWLGFWIYFLLGVFLFAPLLRQIWGKVPGDAVSLGGALLKGTMWGIVLWILAGLLLPLFGLLNRLPGDAFESPGFFALNLGWEAAILLLVIHLLYGVALALVANMGRDISPFDTIGWPGYRYAESYRKLQAFKENGHRQ